MSNQIVISSGAKVRSLEGVLTGTAGIVNSVPLGGANGVATLDALGKVPLSQLPASVVTYLGTWNAATNTPTLTNGVGDVGDLYICNVAGTVNFGAGPITFAAGDWVISSGTEWQKSAGASGTVTSVAVTESGDALTITGSPITTSGTINIGFAGTGAQYVKGDGTLATFPTTIDQAKKLITEVYNSTGSTLTKGTVVYINGGQGNLPTVTKAQANNDANSAQTYGVVQSDITNNNNGFVVVIGSLTDLDTQAYPVGTQLYLSGTTAGEWTSTKPSAPIHLVYVAIVVRSHPTQGVVEVRIQNGYELDEIHDVAISSPVNNQGIFYNSSNDLWENKSIATALGYTPANDALVVHLAGTETITGQKTFSSTLFGTDAEFSGSILSPIVSILDSSTYTKVVRLQTLAATNRDVYFPDLNGTVALLEGTQTFTGDKTFNGDILATNYYRVQQNASLGVAPSGYSTFGAINTKLNFGVGVAVSTQKVFQFETSGLTNNTTRVYTLPDASGTLALTSNLSSYVPYTGATTNVDLGSNYLKARTFYSEGSGGGGSYAIKNGTTPSFEDGYTILSSNDYRLNIVSTVSSTTKAVYLGFSGVTATRTFTLPDASGTIALTSNLSSYVPYTGATADVNLGIRGLSSTNSIQGAAIIAAATGATGGEIYLSQGSTFGTFSGYGAIGATSTGAFVFLSDVSSGTAVKDARLNFGSLTNNTTRTYTFPDASGTIALTSNLSSYLPLSGGTLTGALSGTSATFSSSVTAGVLSRIGDVFIGGRTGTAYSAYTDSVVADNLHLGATTIGGAVYINTALSRNLIINPIGGNVGIGTTSPSERLEILGPDGSGAAVRWRMAGGRKSGYLYSDSAGVAIYDTNLNDAGIYLAQNTQIDFRVNGSERMRITSVGTVAINTTFSNTAYKLVTKVATDRNIAFGYQGTDASIECFNDAVNASTPLRIYGSPFYLPATTSDTTGSGANMVIDSITGRIYRSTSSIKYKKDIENYSKGLDILNSLRPVSYKTKSESDNNKIFAGFIAEEVHNAGLNEFVQYSEDGSPDALAYGNMVALLTKAIQESYQIIKDLEQRIIILESKLK